MNKLLIIFIFCIGTSVKAQNIFPEKFSGCNTDQFALENDTTEARIIDKDFIAIIISDFDKKTIAKIDGVLSLQIIVDPEGTSCLLSLENKTNIPTNKLNLKQTIDAKLIWGKSTRKVSAIVILNFDKGDVAMKRLGLNGNTGWHEISDK